MYALQQILIMRHGSLLTFWRFTNRIIIIIIIIFSGSVSSPKLPILVGDLDPI